jgi:hypothetical protein
MTFFNCVKEHLFAVGPFDFFSMTADEKSINRFFNRPASLPGVLRGNELYSHATIKKQD